MKYHELITKNKTETQTLAEKIAAHLTRGDILGLRGDLGSGKTTFVQGLARGLNIDSHYLVSSPTFTFVNEYPCATTTLYHMDFYRLNHEKQAYSLGLENYFSNQGISIIEWFEKAHSYLPSDFLEIQFTWVSEDERKLVFIPHGDRSTAILAKIHF